MLAAMAKTTPPPAVEAEQSAPWLSLRWLVPLATAAAVVLAVVLVREPRELPPAVAPPSSPVDAVAPVAPPPQPEREAAAQAAPTDAGRRDRQETPSAAKSTDARAESRTKEEAPQVLQPIPMPNRTIDGVLVPTPAAPPPPPAAAAPRAALQSSRAMVAVEIESPDPSVRWRIGGASVFRSTDGGTSWTNMRVDIKVPLVAGASPDPRVCWAVGRQATVVVTVDGGETWRRLDFPDPKADLVAVTSTDARSAAVTTADGRTYVTGDGGTTWRLQENPAAPF
jgi:hypothetical protein